MRLFIIVVTLLALSGQINMPMAQDLGTEEIAAAQVTYQTTPNDSSRAALITVLANHRGAPTVNSVQAHMIVMTDDTISGHSDHIIESASAAIAHFEPASDLIPQPYYKARLIAAEARFKATQPTDALLEMAHIEGFAKSYRTSDGRRPDWAKALYWRAHAWRLAMQAHFSEQRGDYPDAADIDTLLSRYRLDQEIIAPRLAAPAPDLPLCDGRIVQSPKLRPPSRAARSNLATAVILRFDQNTDGEVENAEILASVPNEQFGETLLETVAKWRYRPEKRKQVGLTCRLTRSKIVMPIIFQ